MLTREEAKRLSELYSAVAEGKAIEMRSLNTGKWMDVDVNKNDIFLKDCDYRIKPKPKYRSFKNQEECWQEMLKHQPFGWIKGKEGEHHSLITSIIADEEEVYINGISGFVLDEVMEHYTFADGLPFGVKDE